MARRRGMDLAGIDPRALCSGPGKLAQALDYGARTLQVAGDFDACLARIRHIAEKMPSSVNVGTRPVICRRRWYSSGFSPCAATAFCSQP